MSAFLLATPGEPTCLMIYLDKRAVMLYNYSIKLFVGGNMKKLFCALLAAITLLSFASCNDGKKNEKPNAEKPGIEIESWVGHSYDKLFANQGKPSDAKEAYTVYAAKGETEGCAIGLWCAKRSDEILSIRVISGENSNVDVRLYSVRESEVLNGKVYTDPAVLTGHRDEIKLRARRTAAFLAEFTTKQSTPAGDYVYEIGFFDTKGNVVAKHEITLHVWDFALPEEKTFQTSMGYDESPRAVSYDMLLEHNVCGYWLPSFDVLTSEADEYMSNPKVTAFRVDWRLSDEELIETYKKLKTNPNWLKKAFFYPFDEPRTVEHLNEVAAQCERLKRLCPDIKITCAYYTNIQYSDEYDQVGLLSEILDLQCPKLSMWEDKTTYTSEHEAKYGSFADRMKTLQAKGQTVWAYVCNYPEAPYLNVKLTDSGLDTRVLFWQMYQRDIDGFLYWHADYWTELPNENPWASLDTFGNKIYGDGILTYPGSYVSRPGVIASIRLKIIRDGIDDVELMYLAEKVLGEGWAKEKAAIVSKSLISVDVTSEEFSALRIEIGNAIEAAINNK